MVNFNKLYSSLIIVFLVLSNIAFAQNSATKESQEDNYNNDSQEHNYNKQSQDKESYKEEYKAAVQPSEINSKEKETMERFARGDISEEEMKKAAKAKLGDKFDEMNFKTSMLLMKERMDRKDAFSYDNKGYGQGYDSGPSYEGYSKESMVYGMVFAYIGDDIDPREIKQYCNEPEKMADIVISKFREKVGDLQKVCTQAEEQELKCQETSKRMCSQIGKPYAREDATELEKLQSIAYSCPVNKDAIIKACILRNKANIGQNTRQIDESCKKRFEYEGERLLRECDRYNQNQICEREKYMARCMGGIKKEENEDIITSTTGKKCTSVPASCPTVSCIKGAVPYLNPKTCCPDCKRAPMPEYPDENKAQPAPNQPASSPCPPSKDTDCSWDHSNKPIYDDNGCFVKFECCLDLNFIHPPPCDEGYELTLAIDEYDCFYYKCQPISNQPPKPKSTPCPPYESNCKWGVKYSIYDNNGCIVKSICNCPYKRSVPKYCPKGYDLKELMDEYGCPYYECQPPKYPKRNVTETADTCPEIQIPTCPESQTVQKRSDEKGCISYYCETNPITPVATPKTIATCPEQQISSCQSGQSLQKKVDDKGCVYYYCETLQCKEVQKPTCAEGQSMTAKYDEKGCITGYECISVTTTSDNAITGKAILSTYKDYLRNCENSWQQQEKSCASMKESCDKDTMIERCKGQSKKDSEEHLSRTERDCNVHTESKIRAVEDRCSRMDREKQRCREESSKKCEHMKGIAEKCKETLTEESIRKFILEEAKKRCKFTDIVADEDDVKNSDKAEIVLAVLNTATEADMEKLGLFVDGLKEDLKLQDTTVYKGTINPSNFGDIKLLAFVVNAKLSAIKSSENAKEVKAKIVAGQKAEEAAGKLVSLRDSDVPSEYLYIIEDKANDVLNVSDNLKNIEKKEGQRGVGYKIKLFLGLAKAAEQEEIRQLGESKAKLSKSIEALAKLVGEVPNDVAKSILTEQVENLKKQQQDIESLIKTKEKKSKGLLGLFG